jgi:chitodextrinase
VTSATLTWSAARDDVGVTGYAIYVNGTLATKVSGTTVTLAGLEAHTAYRFQVAAFDAAGNQSAKSARKSVRTHRTGWTSKGSALSLAVSRTAAELHVQHGTTGSLTVDNRASTHVRGRRVRFATLAANRWHRLSGQLRRGTHRTTVAVAFLTHA